MKLGSEINHGIIKTYAAEFGMSGLNDFELSHVHFSSLHQEPSEVVHVTETGRVLTDQQMIDMIRECWENSTFIVRDFESSSPLRDEEDTDTMGCETDPMAPGAAEKWFRNLRDVEPEEGGCPDTCPCMWDDPCEMPF
jgi:hypothetical protein